MVEKQKKTTKVPKKAPVSALDRTRAVLSVWSERRKPSEICRELNVTWGILRNWEERALEGMVRALAPRKKPERGPELTDRLQQLIRMKEKKAGVLEARLEKRLVKIQSSRCGKEEKPPLKVEEKG